MKNCGAPIHKEVATKEMMETFRELAKVRNLLLQFSSVYTEANKCGEEAQKETIQLIINIGLPQSITV